MLTRPCGYFPSGKECRGVFGLRVRILRPLPGRCTGIALPPPPPPPLPTRRIPAAAAAAVVLAAVAAAALRRLCTEGRSLGHVTPGGN